MNQPDLPVARIADISRMAVPVPAGEKRTLERIRSYVALMRQQKRDLRAITVSRASLSAFLKSANTGQPEDQRYTDVHFDGIPLEVAHA